MSLPLRKIDIHTFSQSSADDNLSESLCLPLLEKNEPFLGIIQYLGVIKFELWVVKGKSSRGNQSRSNLFETGGDL